MPVPFFIHPELCDLDFSRVDLYELGQFIYDTYQQTVFRPLQHPILPEHRQKFLIWFPEHQHLIEHVNFEFCEMMRQKVLKKHGFHLQDGYFVSKKDIHVFHDYL